MEAPPDWDLLAVVRSCCTTPAAATSTTTAAGFAAQDLHLSPASQSLLPLRPLQPQVQQEQPCFSPSTPTSAASSSSAGALFRFPNPFESPTTSFLSQQQELQDICKPLICTTASSCTTTAAVSKIFQPTSISSPLSSSSSSFIAGRPFTIAEQTPLRRPIKPSQVVFGAPSATSTSQGQRTKKRKNLMKKVCHVPAEGLSSDMWAWRKYGQKPIKGSPYPRGYYRCSSSKGCLARKQVERNRSDPKMFIVTYTAEHNHPMPTHRNSLAGSTRQKPLPAASGDTPSTSAPAAAPPDLPTCSSPSAASLSPKSESKTEADDVVKEENEEDNEMGISDLMLKDDFYVGFEQIDGDDGEDCFSDHFSPPMELPWLASNSGTATAAGGS